MQSAVQDLKARQVVNATLLVVAVGLAFWLLISFRSVFILLIIAAFLGTAIRPLVDWMFKLGIPRAWGVLVIFLLMIAMAVIVGFLLVPLLVDQSANLAVRLPSIYVNLRSEWMASPSRLIRLFATQLPSLSLLGAAPAPTSEVNPLDQVNTLLSITGSFFGGLLALLALFLLTYYWALESERTLRGLLMWIPAQSRENIRTLIAEIEEKVGGFVRGQALLCLSIGLAALIAYTILGLPYTLVLALLAGIFEAVPVVGPLLGALPAALIALAIDPQRVIGVIISTVIIQALENYILVPRIMRRTMGVNPIVSLLALITLSSLLGLVGALVAIPFAAIVQMLLDRFLINRQVDSTETLMGRDYASRLQYEYEEFRQDVRKVLREKVADTDDKTDELEDELERMVNQMDALVGRLNSVEEQP